MNLWLRALWILFRAWFYSVRSSPCHKRTLTFRVHWIDCDLNKHLTNSRYFSFMDLARLDFFFATNLWSSKKSQSCFPILQSVEISFIRSILPGQIIELHTNLLGVDEKYCYIQQQFTVAGTLVADARVRAVLQNGYGARVSPQILVDRQIPNTTPESIAQWKRYLTLKTEESLNP